MTKNIQALIWTIVAILSVIAGVITYESQRPKKSIAQTMLAINKVVDIQNPLQVLLQTPTTTPDVVATTTPTTTPVIIRKRKPAPPTKLSYGDAVAKYGALRIQFAPKCGYASPNQIAAKNPVTVMLDNRSDSTQIIMINGTIYTVNAWDYAVATVTDTNLPKAVGIACNNQFNVAQIFLQK